MGRAMTCEFRICISFYTANYTANNQNPLGFSAGQKEYEGIA
jgi:hypothetical protein